MKLIKAWLLISPGDISQKSDQQNQEIEKVKNQLQSLNELLSKFQGISPDVLISPFKSNIESITGVKLESADFYTPAVIALLLQHLSVTFASLSIVRERRSGAFELFRAAPISPIETLLGKYLSYFIFVVFLMALLSLLLVEVLGAPMLGKWLNYALIIVVMVFTSLGAGFLISVNFKNRYPGGSKFHASASGKYFFQRVSDGFTTYGKPVSGNILAAAGYLWH